MQKTDAQGLYAAMDWLGERQPEIEQQLAKWHLEDGALVLYDVMSTYFEGDVVRWGNWGHSRDEKKGKLQIVFGLYATERDVRWPWWRRLTARRPIPRLVGAFARSTSSAIASSSRAWCWWEIGTRSRKPGSVMYQPIKGSWIGLLCSGAPAIRQLVEAGKIEVSFFDEAKFADIESPEYPGERLIGGKNSLVATMAVVPKQAPSALWKPPSARTQRRLSRPPRGPGAP